MNRRYWWAREREELTKIFALWSVSQWEMRCEFWGHKSANLYQTKQQARVYLSGY